MKKFLKKTEGFTLVELIVVIAILGILAGIAIPAYSGYINKAEETADVQALATVKTAADAAMAAVDTVDEIRVSADGAKISAVVAGEDDDDDVVYELQGDAITASGETVFGAGTDNPDAAQADDIKQDFADYFAGNSISFDSKDYSENGAKWTTEKGWEPAA